MIAVFVNVITVLLGSAFGLLFRHKISKRLVEGVISALALVTILIGIDSDRLFPVEEQKHIASCIPGATYHEITSKFGHDGFLLENDQLTQIIEPLLP